MRASSIIGVILLCNCANPGYDAPPIAGNYSDLSSATCFDPAAYGAIPNDGISDRVALQAAADAAVAAGGEQTVCIGAGIWDCSKAPLGSYNRAACVSVHAGNVTFAGAGQAATTIRLAGDQGNADILLVSFDPGSAGGVQDLTTDTTDAFNTSEQTHALGTTGICSGAGCKPIGPLKFQRITCIHPPAPDGRRKGDCIRLLGDRPPSATAPGTNIYGAVIDQVTFASCARSCIQPQRGVHDLVITRSEFWGDQPIHGESTGGSQPGENTNAEVSYNVFHAKSPTGDRWASDYDIAMSGPPGGGPYEGIKIHHNTGERGYYLYRTSGLEVFATNIDGDMRATTGILEVGNRCDDSNVHDVVLHRRGVGGPLIRFTTRDATSPCAGARVADSVLIQHSVGHGIHAESVSGLQLQRVTMVWTAPAPNHAALWTRATVSRIDNLDVRDTWVHGPVGTAILLSAAPYGFGPASISGSLARGNGSGLKCIGGGGYSGVQYTASQLGSVSCPWVLP